MKRNCLVIRLVIIIPILFIVTLTTFADEKPKYAVDKIPTVLMAKANAIIRKKETTITVKKSGFAEEKCQIVVTILNESGQHFGIFAQFYDKYSSISNLKGFVYDKKGNRIEKLAGKFIDMSATSGFTLHDDSRVKLIQIKATSYPITLEFSYKKEYKGFFILPGFLVYPGYNVAVESSSYTLIEPINNKEQIRFKYQANQYFKETPSETKEGNNLKRTWNVNMLPALEEEILSANFTNATPHLMVAPCKFRFSGTTGSNESWNHIAAWAGQLCVGMDSLSVTTRQHILKLVTNATTNVEKAKILYEYMQQKVRYESVQVGIGSWQPISAETVDRLSYGDCKALTNYMKALLKVAGIKSNYVLVNAGNDVSNIKRDFACCQFNHAILMIPFEKDTVFLECTSQQNPFGYIGSFTDDRDVLVVEGPNGGFLKHTIIYNGEENKTLTRTTISLDSSLNGKFTQNTKYIGIATESIHPLTLSILDKQKEVLQCKNNVSQLKIENFGFQETKTTLPEINETIEGKTTQFSQYANNSSITIPFNLVATIYWKFKRLSSRRSDIVIKRDEVKIDTICYSIPSNFKVTNVPKPIKVDSKFGSYDLQVTLDGNKIEFTRTFKWKKGTFVPENYQELYQFITNINELDKQIILLSRT
jgi:hypothetical protein